MIQCISKGEIGTIPMLKRKPARFVEVNEYFVDSSGFGREGEPALTISQFMDKLKVGCWYAIKEASQFQVYVGEYRLK